MIIYDGVLYPRTYLELMTGHYYILNAKNQLKQLENILDEDLGAGKYKSYPFLEVEAALKADKNVILVEIVNLNDENKEEHIYRWFEVPFDNPKEVLKKISEL